MEHVQYNAPRGQKTASGREAEFFEFFNEEPGGGRRHFCLRWLARRHGFCGTPWSRSSSPSFPCRWSTFLCRRWWTSLRMSSSSSSHCLLLPSRLSKCPRSFLRTPSRSERRSGLRSWRNSWLRGCGWLLGPIPPTGFGPACGNSPRLSTGASPVDPPRRLHRQPRAVYKYWARLRRARTPELESL